MIIESPLHALILLDKKVITRRKTKMRSNANELFLFVRINTLMYPSIVLQDETGSETEWDYKTLRHKGLEIVTEERIVVPLND